MRHALVVLMHYFIKAIITFNKNVSILKKKCVIPVKFYLKLLEVLSEILYLAS